MSGFFSFINFLIRWIASNLSIPFWMIGHVHLTMNVYEDIHEIIMSMGSGLNGRKLEKKNNIYKIN
jgi:hypothetical protein